MIKLFTSILTTCLLVICGVSSVNAAPFKDVIDLLENGGGSRVGFDDQHGSYVVSLEFSNNSSESKAKEQARLLAQKNLSEYINGSNVSGQSSASISLSTDVNNTENTESHFYDSVKSTFSGKINAARVLKQGKYKGKYFVAILIAENEISQKHRLKTPEDEKPNLSGSGQRITTVTAKGVASLKAKSYKQVRETAIQDALRSAVEQANGVNIKGTSGQFGEAMSIAFSAKTTGYVRTYKIDSESEKRGTVVIELTAEIDEGKLVDDARLYLDAFTNATFALISNDNETRDWLSSQIEALGFTLQEDAATASYVFEAKFNQKNVENNRGNTGIQSHYTLTLKNAKSSELVFTLVNDYRKSNIYISPLSRAKQVSKTAALKSIKSKLRLEVIQALAKKAEKGNLYKIIINDANRVDMRIFQHVFNNASNGNVESWQWQGDKKTLVLNLRMQSTLSEAMNNSLDSLYSTYKTEAKNRRPVSKYIGDTEARFIMLRK